MSDGTDAENIKQRETPIVKEEEKEEEKNEEYQKETEEEPTTTQSKITVINSIKTNWMSWLCIIVAVVVISHQNIPLGILTFLLLMILAYLTHRSAHDYRYVFGIKNIFTVLHHYHHEHHDFFSHFSQAQLELTFPIIFAPLYYLYGTIFVDPWIVFLFVLFYSSVHNINYAIFRVNNVHNLHHKHIHTNIGPDICDILFNSKNSRNTEVENTNHYIPNIIIGTIIVLAVKYLYENNQFVNEHLPMAVMIGLCVSFGVLVGYSVYLYDIINEFKKQDFKQKFKSIFNSAYNYKKLI